VSSASARAVDLERGECTGDDEDEVLGRGGGGVEVVRDDPDGVGVNERGERSQWDGGVDEPEALSGDDDVGEGVEPLVEVTRETAPG
jgi:hypothetical protein